MTTNLHVYYDTEYQETADSIIELNSQNVDGSLLSSVDVKVGYEVKLVLCGENILRGTIVPTSSPPVPQPTTTAIHKKRKSEETSEVPTRKRASKNGETDSPLHS